MFKNILVFSKETPHTGSHVYDLIYHSCTIKIFFNDLKKSLIDMVKCKGDPSTLTRSKRSRNGRKPQLVRKDKTDKTIHTSL